MPRSLLNALIVPLAAILLGGCASYTYRNSMDAVKTAYVRGNFEVALGLTAAKAPQDAGSTSGSALLWQLNHAATLRAAGHAAEAQNAWEVAQPLFETAWEKESTHLLRDALGLAVPLAGDTTYYAKAHEGVMLYTYRALDAMELGDIDEARRFIIHAMHFRDEVIAENERRVEKRRETLKQGQRKRGEDDADALTHAALSDQFQQNRDKEGLNDVRNDSFTASDSLLAKVKQTRRGEDANFVSDLSGYQNYANPLTAFLTYLFLKTQGTGLLQTDRNNIDRELGDLAVFAPRNSTVQAELAQNNLVPPHGVAYVIFETGMAPWLDEVRIDIPVPTKYISYIGMAYPQLRADNSYVRALSISTSDGASAQTELLADIDAMAKQIYDDNFPAMIARQISQSVINAAINVALNLAAKKAIDEIKDPNQRALAQIATWGTTAALSYAMTSADIRSWELLPKQFQLAHVAIPPDRTIRLSFPSGSWHTELTLPAGEVMIVLVKSTGPQQIEPTIAKFKLK